MVDLQKTFSDTCELCRTHTLAVLTHQNFQRATTSTSRNKLKYRLCANNSLSLVAKA